MPLYVNNTYVAYLILKNRTDDLYDERANITLTDKLFVHSINIIVNIFNVYILKNESMNIEIL